jgi:hypothetical protein
MLEIAYIHTYLDTYITYHSRFIPVGVAEVTQIFPRNAHVLPKLFSYELLAKLFSNTGDVTGGKPIEVYLRWKSFSRLLRHPWKKEIVAILLFCPGLHTR